MSSKSASRKPTTPKSPEPRTMKEIQEVYVDLRGRAGELQYQVFVLTKDLERINDGLVALNHEAAARQNLDKEAAKATPVETIKTEGATSEATTTQQ